MKRFYSEVRVAPAPQGYGIELDGRPLNTPAKAPLILPSRPLAEEVAAEWSAQSERIRPLDMPMTQLANTALDRVPGRRAEIVDELAAYAETDLVCYRATGPTSLVAAQAAHWQPVLDWTEATYGARLRITEGVLPINQDQDAIAAIRRAVDGQSDCALAALHVATNAAGSVLIGLALLGGALDEAAAFAAASVDERFQIETWGHDDEAQARLDRMRDDIRIAARFGGLLDSV